jgi:CubicO group peptidase (beta-lactamase class C family)
MRRPGSIAAVFVVCAAAVAARPIPGPQLDLGTSALESYIELLRQQAGIPGISGVLLQEGRIVWERGLGMANLETRVRTTPDTPFYIADLSQMFSAVLLLQ